MEKRRTFKRTKPPKPVEKKAEKKVAPVKKAVEKKVEPPVKKAKPVEPDVQSSAKQTEAEELLMAAAVMAAKEAANEQVASHATEAEAQMASQEEHEQAEKMQSDVIVVEETSIAEVISDTDMAGEKRSLSFFWVLLAIFVIFLAGGLAFAFLFQQPQKPEQVYTAPSNTPAPTIPQAPEASAWKIEVLNGSGVPGAAAAMAKKLENLGYTVVKTGNADTADTKTTFYLSKDFIPYKEAFKNNLVKEAITASDGGALETTAVSARIIIGTQ